MTTNPDPPGERGRQLFLRTTREQARREGLDARGFSDDDYAVFAAAEGGDTRVGRIYKELIGGTPMWRWVIEIHSSPMQGVAESLEEAEADLKRRYREGAGPPEGSPDP